MTAADRLPTYLSTLWIDGHPVHFHMVNAAGMDAAVREILDDGYYRLADGIVHTAGIGPFQVAVIRHETDRGRFAFITAPEPAWQPSHRWQLPTQDGNE